MNHGWEKKRLGDLCAYHRGLTYSKDDEVEKSSKSVLRANNINLETSSLNLDELKYLREDFYIAPKYLLSKDSILICMSSGSKSHLGKVAFIDKDSDYAFGGFMGLIIPKTNARFLYLFMTSPFFRSHLQKITNGININNLKFSTLQDVFVPVPAADVQTKIVTELDRIKALIEIKRNQLKDLGTLAQSLFYETFGEPFINSKGWQIMNFGDLASSINYGTSLPAVDGGYYPYIRMNNLTDNGYLDLSNLKYIDIPESELDKCLVRKGDILFNRTNSREKVGKSALFDRADKMVIAGYIIRVRAKADMLNPVFAVRYLNLPELKEHLRKICRGAVNQANINSKEMASIPFIVPPINLQNQFASKIEAIEAQKKLVEASIADLETLFASRMDYWFND